MSLPVAALCCTLGELAAFISFSRVVVDDFGELLLWWLLLRLLLLLLLSLLLLSSVSVIVSWEASAM